MYYFTRTSPAGAGGAPRCGMEMARSNFFNTNKPARGSSKIDSGVLQHPQNIHKPLRYDFGGNQNFHTGHTFRYHGSLTLAYCQRAKEFSLEISAIDSPNHANWLRKTQILREVAPAIPVSRQSSQGLENRQNRFSALFSPSEAPSSARDGV